MGLLPEQCVHDDCDKTRHGLLFCEVHAKELQVVIASLSRGRGTSASCDAVLLRCCRVLVNFNMGCVTDGEMNCMLLDILLHSELQPPEPCWQRCFRTIPLPMLHRLLAACPTARMFSPPRYSEVAFAVVKQDFREYLTQWLSGHLRGAV